ncbi:MAG: lasso peptide biosynthesis B2 protein [Thermostichus sp. DG02_5_bins_236]
MTVQFLKRCLSKLAKWRFLSAIERGLLLKALVLLLAARLMLVLVPFQVWRPMLLKLISVQAPHEASRSRDSEVKLSQVIRAIDQASWLVPGVKCLARALTAGILLRRYGFVPSLQLGAKLDRSMGFSAHAWVVCDGSVVIGGIPELDQYSMLQVQEGIPL